MPPYTCQLPSRRTDTPVSTAASAATSSSVRMVQPSSFCHEGLGSCLLQPLPVPMNSSGSFHTVSLQPRGLAASLYSDVPPTATTFGDDAGKLVCRPMKKYVSS